MGEPSLHFVAVVIYVIDVSIKHITDTDFVVEEVD